jgi:hypothetical protein
MAIKTFTTGEVLTAADTNTYLANSGLVYITSVALSGASNNISNCFSSTYDAYRVTITNFNNSTSTVRIIGLQFRTTSNDGSANYFYSQYGHYSATAFNASASGQTSSEFCSISAGGNNGGSVTIDISNPNLAFTTTFAGNQVGFQNNVAAIVMRYISGGINTTTQYTGFSINTDGDSLSGTVTVYGYRKA